MLKNQNRGHELNMKENPKIIITTIIIGIIRNMAITRVKSNITEIKPALL